MDVTSGRNCSVKPFLVIKVAQLFCPNASFYAQPYSFLDTFLCLDCIPMKIMIVCTKDETRDNDIILMLDTVKEFTILG